MESTIVEQPLLSDRIQNMKESATLKMAALGRELKAQGADIISLSLGEPDFDTPQHVKEAAKKAIDENYSHYTPVPGYMDLREAISHKFKRDNNLDYTPDQIVTSTGAKQTLVNLMLCLINPGDEAILPAPYWVSYEAQILLAGGGVIGLPTSIETDFKATPEQLEAAITDKTRVFLFSSPCNPSGSVYTQDELEGLAEVLAKHEKITIIADEIYEHINFTNKHASIGTIESIKDRVVTVNGLSKGFAMTGWRLGYMGAPLWIAKACNKMQGQFTSATCSITQRAAIAALGDNLAPTYEMKASFLKRRALILEKLREIEGLEVNDPQGAFYVFPSAKSFVGKTTPDGKVLNSVDDLCMHILNTVYVSVVPGSAFGNENCFRISYASSEENLIEACSRMKTCMEALK